MDTANVPTPASPSTPTARRRIPFSIPWALYLLVFLFIYISGISDPTQTNVWDWVDLVLIIPAVTMAVLYIIRKTWGRPIIWKILAPIHVIFDILVVGWLSPGNPPTHGWAWLVYALIFGPFAYLVLRYAYRGVPAQNIRPAKPPMLDAGQRVVGPWRKVAWITSIVLASFYGLILLGVDIASAVQHIQQTVSAYLTAPIDLGLAVLTIWAVAKRKRWGRWMLLALFALAYLGHEFQHGTWFWVYYFLAFFAIYFTVPELWSKTTAQLGQPAPKFKTAQWLWIWLAVTLFSGLLSIAHGGDPVQQLGSFGLVLVAAIILSLRDFLGRRAVKKKQLPPTKT